MDAPVAGVENPKVAVHSQDEPKACVAVREVHIAYYIRAVAVDAHTVVVSPARHLPAPAPPSLFHDHVLVLVHSLFRLFPCTLVGRFPSLYPVPAAPTLSRGLDLGLLLVLVPAILAFPFQRRIFYCDPRNLSYPALFASHLSELLLLSPVFRDQGGVLFLFLF